MSFLMWVVIGRPIYYHWVGVSVMVDHVPEDAFRSVEPCGPIGYSYNCQKLCFCTQSVVFSCWVRCANSIRYIAETTYFILIGFLLILKAAICICDLIMWALFQTIYLIFTVCFVVLFNVCGIGRPIL